MVEGGDGLRFTLEALAALDIQSGASRQDLEGAIPVQARIARAINLAHSAFAELDNDSYGPSFLPITIMAVSQERTVLGASFLQVGP